LLNPLIDATGLAIPSWEAVVGTLIKGIPFCAELSLATSIFVPPPTPKTTCGLATSICFSTSFTSSTVEEFTREYSTAIPESSKISLTFLPAISNVLKPLTMNALFLNPSFLAI
jgi:hypothetical protein